ncbi:MAG: TIGR04086 family membrane protein [Clostridia bacterium]|nr:TIGR04086 family membrane protein [Clostridia bacterium]
MKKKTVDRKKTGSVPFAKALLFGTLAGLSAWTVLLVIAAYVLSGRSEPENYIIPAVFALAALSALIAGLTVSKTSDYGVLLPGIVQGLTLLALVFVLSLAFSGDKGEESVALKALLCADFLIFSLLGAKLAQKSPKKRAGRGK